MVASARLAALRSHACEPLRLEEPCQRLARAGHCGGSGGAATGPTARCSSAGLADVRRHERSRDKRQRGVVRARRGRGVSFRMRRSQTQHTPRNAGLRAFRAWRPRGKTRERCSGRPNLRVRRVLEAHACGPRVAQPRARPRRVDVARAAAGVGVALAGQAAGQQLVPRRAWRRARDQERARARLLPGAASIGARRPRLPV